MDDLKMQVLRDIQQREGGEIVGGKLYPIGGHLGDLVEDDRPCCTILGSWYVVEADSRHEREAAESINAAGFATYLPTVSGTRVVRGRKVDFTRPMFGRYLFVKCQLSDEVYHRVRLARHVRRFLEIGGRCLAVAEKPMEVVRLVEAKNTKDPASKQQFVYHFSPGDVVRIVEGPFAWFYAKLESAVDEHGRLTALVDLFGRQTPVQFEASQLRAL